MSKEEKSRILVLVCTELGSANDMSWSWAITKSEEIYKNFPSILILYSVLPSINAGYTLILVSILFRFA